jgi:predicted  nucleic acid-binding Zn-ribbon protein
MAKTKAKDTSSVEENLKALYDLQQTDSELDRIRLVKGELPLEVEDLKAEIEGLEGRHAQLLSEIDDEKKKISNANITIQTSQDAIKRYEEDLKDARNNRQYEFIEKEREYQELVITDEKIKIGKYEKNIDAKNLIVGATDDKLTERRNDLSIKEAELEEISKETEKKEKDLLSKSEKLKKNIEARLLKNYEKIRANAFNGMSVVDVYNNCCGGCYSKIPPQMIIDIQSHKKFISCENCGRLLVDFAEEVEA